MIDRSTCIEPIVVGIVGGIASGKSKVTDLFQEFGGKVISADLIAHEVLRLPDIVERIVAEFGSSILTDATSMFFGEARVIDRKKLGTLVFDVIDPQSSDRRRLLESIVHPRIRQIARQQLEQLKDRCECAYIVLDAPLLVEGGWLPFCDKLVFVDTPDELRRKFAMERGWSEKEWLDREAAQLSIQEKRRLASDILPNDKGLDELKRRLSELVQSWHAT
jgi:dephospho-CoA kinase